ncbi:MAG: HD domain-containing protein [Planctomycetia bacterium]|nr:HD domain-containing protein [Planctomycetia bacterium]
MPFSSLPELSSLDSVAEGVRIPPGVTVPITPRVRRLLDTAEMRRLARISQLGLVGLVYPGAVHTRFEHSLGVYRLALEFLGRLRHDPRFEAAIDEEDAATFIVAALVHDVGHWAFCHPVEDMGIEELPSHESRVRAILSQGAPAEILARDWGLAPQRVAELIEGGPQGSSDDGRCAAARRILHSLLSGPIDVDKMDYLARDSLHAGVPYGSHFDQERLLRSLCLDERGEALAITDKGRTAAELMVFARYVMFSEVYWHHAVRAATAMLQRAVWIVRDTIEPASFVRFDDGEFVDWLMQAAAGTSAAPLADGLFGPTRRLFKRVAGFDSLHHPRIHRLLSGRTHADAVDISHRLAAILSRRLGRTIPGDSLIIDAPPAQREVEFTLQVRERPGLGPDEGVCGWRQLAELSPVVRSLAREQFDDIVKRVRIFAPAEAAAAIANCPGIDDLVAEAAGSPG